MALRKTRHIQPDKKNPRNPAEIHAFLRGTRGTLRNRLFLRNNAGMSIFCVIGKPRNTLAHFPLEKYIFRNPENDNSENISSIGAMYRGKCSPRLHSFKKWQYIIIKALSEWGMRCFPSEQRIRYRRQTDFKKNRACFFRRYML